MALKTREEKVINLGNIVSNNIAGFVAARNRVRAARSAEFYQRVVDEGTDVSEQVAYFQGWLKEEKEKGVIDSEFIKELKINISDLKKIERSNKFYDKYRQSFEAYKTGRKGVEEHINYLENELSGATDNDLKVSIEGYLTTARTEKVTIDNNILTNQVNLAMNDKRELSLLDAIGKVQKAKNKALAGNNLELASSFDLNLQALNSQLQNTRITDEVHNMEIDMMGKPFTPTAFLDELTTRLNRADSSETPITINGKRYDNAKQYWQFQRNDYVEEDFMTLLSADYKAETDAASLELNPVLEAKIKEQFNELNSLKLNPVLTPYLDKLEQLQINNSAYGVNQLGAKIVRDYDAGKMGDTSESNLNNTLKKLNELNQFYGVDVAQNKNSVIEDAVAKDLAISEAQSAKYQEAIAGGATPEEAWAQARSGVTAIDIPAEEVLKREPIDIAKERVKGLDKPEEEKSKFDITGRKVDFEQPKVSAPAEAQELGERIPDESLLKFIKPEDTIKQGGNIFLKAGAKAPYQKVLNLEDRDKWMKEQGKTADDFAKTSTGDIFVRN